MSLTAPDKVLIAFEDSKYLSDYTIEKERTFSEKLRGNFLVDNLWFSIFISRSYSNYNRTARVFVSILTLFIAMLTNVMWYKQETGYKIKMGPFYYSPSLPYITMITTIMTIVPSILFTFEKGFLVNILVNFAKIVL